MAPHTQKYNFRIVALNVLLPLTAGVAIYLLWRSPSLRVFHWLAQVQLLEPVMALRRVAEPVVAFIPHWALFSLPDGLWAYSLSSAIILTWQRHPTRAWIVWFMISSSLGVTSEVGQYLGVVPGTFEYADLFFYAIGSTMPLLLFMRGRLHEIAPNYIRRNPAILRRLGCRQH